MENKKQIWFNRGQRDIMVVGANNLYGICSRAFGKSVGVDAPELAKRSYSMPRCCGALLSPTYGKLLMNTLPAVCEGLANMGIIRDVHYVLGKKPPKHLNFQKPHIEPFRYEYVMWFSCGTIVHLVSFDRPMSVNSMNLDFVMGFEAKFLNYEKIINEVLPANRGNERYFRDNPWHHGVVFTTDMPTSKTGQWIFEKEKEMDKDLIDMIRLVYAKYKVLKSMTVRSVSQEREMKELYRDLTLYRKNATFYAEYDIFDNLEVIGEKRIRDFKRELPPFIFQTAILNKRPRKVPNGFYSALNEKNHCYEASNNSFFEGLDYDLTKSRINDCRKDGDIVPGLPLRITLDYNAAINNIITAQVVEREQRTLNWQYVKTPRKLKELVNDWCDYYHHNSCHDVIYYFNKTAIAESADGDARPFYEIVTEMLHKRGFNVTPVYTGQTMRHDKKHHYIDLALKGDAEYLFPTFNAHNCEYLLLAMGQTGIKQGRNGFEKDKDIEKTPDSPDNPDELKTHGTDAWDDMFIGCNFHAAADSSVSIASSFH